MGSLQEQYLSSGPSFRAFSSTDSSAFTYNKDGLSLVHHADTTDQSDEQFLPINQSKARTALADQSEVGAVESDQSASTFRFSQTNHLYGKAINSHNYHVELSQTLLGSERFNNKQSSSDEFFDLAGRERETSSTTQTLIKSHGSEGGDNDQENMSTLVLQEEDSCDDVKYRCAYMSFSCTL